MPSDKKITRIAADLALIRADATRVQADARTVWLNARRALEPLWPKIDALMAEWARIEPVVAAKEREDRLYATLLDPDTTEKGRHCAAEAIVAEDPLWFPPKLSGGRRRWRAWQKAAEDIGKDHRALLRDLLVLGLAHAARPERLSTPATIKIAYEETRTAPDGKSVEFRQKFRVYRGTAPEALPPDDLRLHLRRQAFKAAEEYIGEGDAPLRVPVPSPAALIVGRTAQQKRVLLTSSEFRRLKPMLSPRECQVGARLAEGESAATIAQELGIQPGTVRVFKHRLLKKYADM